LLADHVYRVAVEGVGDGGFRHHHLRLLARQQHLEVGEHARQQLVVRVGQGGAHLHVAGGFLYLGVEGADLAFEDLARVGGQRHAHVLTDGQLRVVLLGQEEVDVQLGQVLQGGEGGARAQVVAGVHLADADGAGEGSEDALLVQFGLELGDAGLGLEQLGVEPVELALGDGLLARQVLAALVLDTRQGTDRLGGGQDGALHVAVQLQQRLTEGDLLAGLEQHFLDRALYLGGQVHALVGLERADGRQAALPGAFLGHGGGHADGRLRRREHLDLLVDGEALVGGEGEYHDEYHAQHDEHAAEQHIPNPWQGERAWNRRNRHLSAP